MKVKKMIEELQKYNPEADVVMNQPNGYPVLFVLAQVGKDNTVWLEGEDDCDLKTELEARIENAIDEGQDELDYYMELLDIGITVDMVRKYMGSETAEIMQQFCEDHGLL